MDVTRDDSQRRFLVQHRVAALLRHCFAGIVAYNIVPTLQRCVALDKNRRCESSRQGPPTLSIKGCLGSKRSEIPAERNEHC